ncbi:hypothetical protein GQ42DRAFT_35516 [Ramicandelaber brevisporus]|nr:hypothetical protein GQ42DRAFT_35516 [Ramicandelaber brevisporus]
MSLEALYAEAEALDARGERALALQTHADVVQNSVALLRSAEEPSAVSDAEVAGLATLARKSLMKMEMLLRHLRKQTTASNLTDKLAIGGHNPLAIKAAEEPATSPATTVDNNNDDDDSSSASSGLLLLDQQQSRSIGGGELTCGPRSAPVMVIVNNKSAPGEIPMIPLSPLVKLRFMFAQLLLETSGRLDYMNATVNRLSGESILELSRLTENQRIYRTKLDMVKLEINNLASRGNRLTQWDAENLARELALINAQLFASVDLRALLRLEVLCSNSGNGRLDNDVSADDDLNCRLIIPPGLQTMLDFNHFVSNAFTSLFINAAKQIDAANVARVEAAETAMHGRSHINNARRRISVSSVASTASTTSTLDIPRTLSRSSTATGAQHHHPVVSSHHGRSYGQHLSGPHVIVHALNVASLLIHAFRDFGSAAAIMSAVISPAVTRLTVLWHGVAPETIQKLTALAKLFVDMDNTTDHSSGGEAWSGFFGFGFGSKNNTNGVNLDQYNELFAPPVCVKDTTGNTESGKCDAATTFTSTSTSTSTATFTATGQSQYDLALRSSIASLASDIQTFIRRSDGSDRRVHVMAVPWINRHWKRVRQVVRSYGIGTDSSSAAATTGGVKSSGRHARHHVVVSEPGAQRLSAIIDELESLRFTAASLRQANQTVAESTSGKQRPTLSSKQSQLPQRQRWFTIDNHTGGITNIGGSSSNGSGHERKVFAAQLNILDMQSDIALQHWLLTRPFETRSELVEKSAQVTPRYENDADAEVSARTNRYACSESVYLNVRYEQTRRLNGGSDADTVVDHSRGNSVPVDIDDMRAIAAMADAVYRDLDDELDILLATTTSTTATVTATATTTTATTTTTVIDVVSPPPAANKLSNDSTSSNNSRKSTSKPVTSEVGRATLPPPKALMKSKTFNLSSSRPSYL